MQDEVIVLSLPNLWRDIFRGDGGPDPAHAEVAQQGATIIQLEQEVLCSPIDRRDGSTSDGLSKSIWEWESQVGALDVDRMDALTFEERCEATANRFNFG